MIRCTMTFAAFLCFLPHLSANLSPRNDFPTTAKTPLPRTARDAAPDLDKPAAAPAAEAKPESPKLVLTDKTEVQLDGQACKLADVPGTAAVVGLEVAADKKTILKIHFQSKK